MEKEVKIPADTFDKSRYRKFICVADVGGNHTYGAIMGVKSEKIFELIFKYYKFTKDLDTISIFLNHVLKNAKEMYDIEVDTAVIGVAGTVNDPDRKTIKLTHLDLTIKVHDILLSTLIKKVVLLNDFEAEGYGVDHLIEEKDFVVVTHPDRKIPKRKKDGTACVIGAGFGLGCTILPYDKSTGMRLPMASEAGHMDFNPISNFDKEFQSYLIHKILNNKMKIPDAERFVSGRGLIDMWHYLRSVIKDDTDIAKNIDFLLGNEKLDSIFINYYNDKTCKKTVDMFLKYYAQFARNMAMVTECYGGLFISGGIAQKHVNLFLAGDFMLEFEKTDMKGDILNNVPAYIITNKEVGLYGCCNVAVNFLDHFLKPHQ